MSVVGTLTVQAAEKILEAIRNYLSTRRPKEIGGLKKNLVDLVEKSSNSSVVLSQYLTLNRRTLEASVHCTELTGLLSVISDNAVGEQFKKLIEVRIQDNLKAGVEAIRRQKDYPRALQLYERASKNAEEASDNFATDRKLSKTKLKQANEALSDLAKIGNDGLDDLLTDLQGAYKVLVSLK